MSGDAPEEALMLWATSGNGIAFRPGDWHLLVSSATRGGLEPGKTELQRAGYPPWKLACVGEKLACADNLLLDNRLESTFSEFDQLAFVGAYYKGH